MQNLVTELDQVFFLMLNKCHHPVIDHFFRLVTSHFFSLPLYIFLILFIRKNLGWYGVMLFVLTIAIADQCSATLLKPLFGRYRPCYAMDMLSIHLVGTHKGLYGFPSSHASNTFAFAMLFWKIFKWNYKYSYLFFIWATIVSYGRIYGGVHYPLDILGGAILGSGIGMSTYQVYKRSK
ncbi:phosphatase PAP2 family protein [Candidatus Cardinium hertigii]|jgi:undecaprenyl-diphosphatase|uniref:Phosphatase PAP2 family protein n=1 Tax=Candidatus Cardinium hertigii TaxID=247481 RepID=A0A3N2QCB7_9BACT|nr:phosphatase PAP2 family protein [Candidatus Cardinium hertigii]ROT47458.1 phosphatase PAP2 family protein [Candidatus Cardinium hertigii]